MDYDGDELNFIPLLSREMEEYYEGFAPQYNVPGKTPYEVCGNLTLLGPANNIMLEYLNAKHEHPEKDTILRELL